MAWYLEKFPNKCKKKGRKKPAIKQNVPQNKPPSKFHPQFCQIQSRLNLIFPRLPQEKKWSPFFVRVAILQFEDLVPGDRVSDGLQVQVPSKNVVWGSHSSIHEEWMRTTFFFWLSSCVLVEFIPSKFCLQIVRSSKIPKGFLKHHMFGRFGLGPFLFFVDHGNSCGFLQMTWDFLQQLCRLCTQQNTKGTEWESPSCRPVSHNSTRTSGRMQKSFGCFCLEKMKPERLRKKKGGETKKSNEFDVFLFVTH